MTKKKNCSTTHTHTKIPKTQFNNVAREFIHEFILTATNYFLISIIKSSTEIAKKSIYKRILQIINKRHIIL